MKTHISYGGEASIGLRDITAHECYRKLQALSNSCKLFSGNVEKR